MAITTAAGTLAGGVALAGVDIDPLNTDYPLVAPGGTFAFETQVLEQDGSTTAPGLTINDIVVMALPDGVNFSGTPTATVSPATGNSLFLKNSSGDPSTKGVVTLSDTNDDGGMDRMQFEVATDAAAGDQIRINGSATYSGTSTKDNLEATIFIEETETAPTGFERIDSKDNVLATKTKTLNKPLMQTADDEDIIIPNDDSGSSGEDPVSLPGISSLIFTLPAGTEEDSKAVFTLGSGLRVDSSSNITVTALTDNAPAITDPTLTDSSSSFTLTVPSDADVESQYLLTATAFETSEISKAGPVAVNVSGAAAGSATIAILADNGSTTELTNSTITAADTKLVAGAEAFKLLPEIDITENFEGDLASPDTITLLAGSGMEFDTGSTVTVTDNSGTDFTTTVTVEDDNIEIAITGNGADGADTITIGGIEARATDTASGTLNIQVGDPDAAGESSNVPGSVLSIATAQANGMPVVEGPDDPDSVGTGAGTGTVTVTEPNYGSVTKANATSTSPAFLRIASNVSGISVTGVSVDQSAESTAGACGIDFGGGPGGGPVVAGAASPADGSYIVSLTAESCKADVTDLVISYSIKSSVPVGTDVAFALTSNIGVEGTAVVATVNPTTKNSVGTIPSVDPGSTEIQTLAPITIGENFAGALTLTDPGTDAGVPTIRLLAQGNSISFAPGSVVSGATTVTVDTTVRANDTLVITGFTDTGGKDSITVTPRAFIEASAPEDSLLPLSIADGDGDPDTDDDVTNVVTGPVNVAYTGDVDPLDAGSAQSVNIGFKVTNTVEGGVPPYTVSVDDSAVGSAMISGADVTVTGVGEGDVTVTVTDSLNSNDTFIVTVAEGAEIPAFPGNTLKTDGSSSNATFTGGVTSDGGTSFNNTVPFGQHVDVIGSIIPDNADVGKAGELFIAVRFVDANGVNKFLMMNQDGNLLPWDLTEAGLVPAHVRDSLAASEDVQIFSGMIPAPGVYRVYLGYAPDGESLTYTGSPIIVTVE